MTPANTFSKAQIFRAACRIARKRGLHRTLKQHVADHLGCATGTINHHWKTIRALRAAVRRHAIERKDMALVTGK